MGKSITLMGAVVLFLSGIVMGAAAVVMISSCNANTSAPKKLGFKPISAPVNAGTVKTTATISYLSLISSNTDNSSTLYIDVAFNGAHRTRGIYVSPDGTSFKLDGLAISSPPGTLQALGAHLSAFPGKLSAALSTPSIVTLLTAP